MRSAVLLGAGMRLYLVPPEGGPLESFPVDSTAERAADRLAREGPREPPPKLLEALRALPTDVALLGVDPSWAASVSGRLGRSVTEAPIAIAREARARLPQPDPTDERTFLRTLARLRLERSLASPEEVLISLAREEERLERALGREERAAEAFVAAPRTALEGYARTWKESRQSLSRHHAALRLEVESEARALLPNLSAVVGARVAARLLSAAGGRTELGRLRGPRLQVLGSRRRPSAEHGPRYGLIYRAERMDELPLARRGAFARSLAALAAIAARGDTITRSDLTATLRARRERRFRELSRRKD